MESNKELTIKGIPMYLVALVEYLTQLLPSIILWLTFFYGVIQLILVSRQLIKDYKKDSHAKADFKNSDDH